MTVVAGAIAGSKYGEIEVQPVVFSRPPLLLSNCLHDHWPPQFRSHKMLLRFRSLRPFARVVGRFLKHIAGAWSMPAVYEKMGIRFFYPDNWTLDEDDAAEGNSVSVYSPEGSFWSVVLDELGEPGEMALTAMRAIKQEYEQVEAEPVSETIAGQAVSGYDLNFYCLDLTNTALVRGFRTKRGGCVVVCQAEDRDFTQVEPVFRAITTSLLGRV